MDRGGGGSNKRPGGDVSLGVVTGVRAESASDSGTVLHNERQQSLLPRGFLRSITFTHLYSSLSACLALELSLRLPSLLLLPLPFFVFPPLFHTGWGVNRPLLQKRLPSNQLDYIHGCFSPLLRQLRAARSDCHACTAFAENALLRY